MGALENYCNLAAELQGVLLYNEPLAEYTTWRVGGLAAKLYKPKSTSDLVLFLRKLPKTEPLLWLRLGSNALIRDSGFSGTVILTQGYLKERALLDAQTVEEWFISATFKLNPSDKESSLHVIKDLVEHRANTQPTNEYNCGSVFRNPPGHFAARLIDGCGLKGFNLGGAVVSPKHANFIINHQASATAADIEALIRLVQTKVREQTTIELMREVHIIGD